MTAAQEKEQRSSGTRWLFIALLIFLFSGLALVGALAWLGNSDAGTRLIARKVSEWMPQLVLEVADGDLATGLQLRSVGWQDDAFQVEAHDVSLSWAPACLLTKQLCLAQLHIGRLQVNVEPSADTGPVRLPVISTPWPLVIGTLGLSELLVNVAGEQSVRLADITARKLALRGARLSAADLTISHAGQVYEIGGNLTLQGDYPLQLELAMRPQKPLPAMVAQLSGTLRKLAYQLTEVEQLPLVLEGSVDLLEEGNPLQARFYSTAEFEVPPAGLPFRFRRLSGELSGDTDLVSLTFDGALLAPTLAGEQVFTLAATVRPAPLVVEIQSLQARVLGYPLQLRGQLAWSAQRGFEARRASIRQGENRLAVDGELDGAGVEWSLTVPQLQAYQPDLAGELSAHGLARSVAGQFDLGASVSVANLRYQQQTLTLAELECRWQGAVLEEPLQLHCQNLLLELPARGGLPAMVWLSDSALDLGVEWSQAALSVGPGCLRNRDEPAQRLCSTDPLRVSADGLAALSLYGRELPLSWLERVLDRTPVLAGRWNFNVQLPAAPGSPASWVVTAPQFGELKGNLSYADDRWHGSLASNGVQLSPLLPLFPQLRNLEGKLRGNVAFQQDEQGIRLNGLAALEDGRLGLFAVDSLVEQIAFSVQFDGRRAGIDGAFSVEDKAITLNGGIDWQTRDWSAQLRMQAQNIELEPLAGMVATLSTDLTLSATAESVSLQGDIIIPRARLDASGLSSGVNAINLSPDTEIIGQDKTGSGGPELDLNVALRLGEDVQFQGYGLFGSLRGGLDLEKRGQRPLQANGRIVLANSYFRAYGQDLIVEEGRLEFSGSLYNPDIRLRAYRRHTVDDAVVGIIARGPIAQPDLRLYSSVPMSEQEKMQYLLTGRLPDPATGPGDGAMSQAAVAVGLAGANASLGAYAERLGIQGFEVGTAMGEQGQEAQVSGYFGPRLYLKYGQSLFDTGTVFSARYQLTDQFYVQGYQGTQGAQSALELLWYVRRRQNDEFYPESEDAVVEDGKTEEAETEETKTGVPDP